MSSEVKLAAEALRLVRAGEPVYAAAVCGRALAVATTVPASAEPSADEMNRISWESVVRDLAAGRLDHADVSLQGLIDRLLSKN